MGLLKCEIKNINYIYGNFGVKFAYRFFLMRNFLLGTSLLLGSFVAPSIAEESNDFYLSIGGGIAFPNDSEGDSTLGGTVYDIEYEVDNTGVFSVGVGKEFNKYRLEFNYLKATIESDTFTVTSGGTGITSSITPALESDVSSYMIYGYKDFSSDSKITPYAAVGLGLGHFSAKDQTATVAGTAYQFEGGDETVFSFGLKGGVTYEIADNTSIYSEAMYQNFASYDVSEPGYETVNYDSTNYFAISAGLKFNF